jgi:hypothetical protein
MVVFVKSDLTVAWSQGQTFLKKGDSWDSNAELVRERPDLFESSNEEPAGSHKPIVERATRAPGEVRRTPNPRRIQQ